MSTKFEQLLDYLVNEEHDKANELFHEIVVEKSREIYESLLAEEAEEDNEQQDESVEEDEEQQDESVESEEEQQDEGFMPEEGEEYYDEADDEADDEMPDSDDEPMVPQDQGDDLEFDTSSSDDVQQQLADIVGELQAVLDQMDGEEPDEFDSDETSMPVGGDEENDDDKDLQMGVYEGKKRMTREYVEKVGSDWEKGSTQKSQGQYAGAGTGDKESAPVEGKSPIASGKNKPGPANVNASNILGDMKTGEGTNVGTKPTGKAGGLVKPAQDMKTGNQNVPGGKVSVKGLTKVSDGHGPEKKGAGPGPVGAGTGDKAGQTSIAPETKKQFLKPYSK
jgi:hypothetical protein